jgi:hypothetical protein
MPGSLPSPVSPLVGPGTFNLGQCYPGGSLVIVSASAANPTLVTTLCPHGLNSGDTIFWTASTGSTPALTTSPQQVVTVVSPTTFTMPVNVTVAATAGAYEFSILSVPVTTTGVPATFYTGVNHGLRVGDSVTIVATGASSAVGTIDGANTVTAIPDPRSFTVGACTNVTVPGSATAGHFSKTTFNSDVFDNKYIPTHGLITLVSVIGTNPPTVSTNLQGSMDGATWYNVAYGTMAAPQTLAVAALTITTAVTTTYVLTGPGAPNYIPWRFFRVGYSSSTNIIVTATLSALPLHN